MPSTLDFTGFTTFSALCINFDMKSVVLRTVDQHFDMSQRERDALARDVPQDDGNNWYAPLHPGASNTEFRLDFPFPRYIYMYMYMIFFTETGNASDHTDFLARSELHEVTHTLTHLFLHTHAHCSAHLTVSLITVHPILVLFFFFCSLQQSSVRRQCNISTPEFTNRFFVNHFSRIHAPSS